MGLIGGRPPKAGEKIFGVYRVPCERRTDKIEPSILVGGWVEVDLRVETAKSAYSLVCGVKLT